MLYVRHDFYNIIFKMKNKIVYRLRVSPPPQGKILGAHGRSCDCTCVPVQLIYTAVTTRIFGVYTCQLVEGT